ncbi:helix-turn-helix domain-containing protein [Streptomyces sp. NPDC057617]|uniref:helix-turn-helix domain-containing protein n=1 Tax=Streptomyces sp. NPDC057617 TaxID=3346184 RepID=UPI0036A473D1
MTPAPKPGAKADRDALRHEMTATGCTPAQIATEMRVRFRLRPREAWRHALGWTLQETAERISAMPEAAVAADASLVGKWEKWPGPSSRRPTLQILVALAAVYGCSVEDVLDLEDRRVLPESDLRILRHRAPDQPVAVAADAVIETQPDPDRVRAAATESAAWAQWAEATNVGEIALEQILADVRTLASEYLTGDPIALFGRTRRLRDRVSFFLRDTSLHASPQTSTYRPVTCAGCWPGSPATSETCAPQTRKGVRRGCVPRWPGTQN